MLLSPLRFLLGTWLLALTAGCSSLSPAQFANAMPLFDPLAYFNGHTHSSGVFENRAGAPAKRFTTDCQGRLAGGVLTLDQDFAYDDGHHQQRHWLIRRLDAHRIEATASDVIGTGTGEAYGNAFRWEYTVELEPGNVLSRVRLKQWMYLQPGDHTLLNRATVSKSGIEVAQVAEVFEKG